MYVEELPCHGQKLLLRNGPVVLIRPVRPSDGDLLLDGFARLSPGSRYARFLTAKPELTPNDLRYFTRVDHFHHDAIGAIDPLTGCGVGIARFVRSRTEPPEAEVAITVVDDWQRRGVGSALLMRLAERAWRVGIFAFTAVVAADNEAMIGLLRRGHPGIELTGVDGDVLEYAIALASFAGRLTA